jgi:hypothetical protein
MQIPKKILNVKIKEKYPRFLPVFKIWTTGFKIYHTEGRKSMERNWERGVGRQKLIEGLGC